MTYCLTLENLLDLIAASEFGPVRDLGLLASGAHRPQTSLFGQDAYPSIDHKAAALLESLVRNHALVDGNKRLGWIAAMVFFGPHGIGKVHEGERQLLVITRTPNVARGPRT